MAKRIRQETKILQLRTQVPMFLREPLGVDFDTEKKFRVIWTKEGRRISVRLKKVS